MNEPTGKSGELKRYIITPIYNHSFGDMRTKEQPAERGPWVLYTDALAALDERDAEIERLRKALDAALDFANSHSLPCLEKAIDMALEEKK